MRRKAIFEIRNSQLLVRPVVSDGVNRPSTALVFQNVCLDSKKLDHLVGVFRCNFSPGAKSGSDEDTAIFKRSEGIHLEEGQRRCPIG